MIFISRGCGRIMPWTLMICCCSAVRLLQDTPAVLAKYQEKFRYVLIDEYQDTNKAQYLLARLLAAKHRNIFVVGDIDQSIYGWRGADIRNILDFEADYPDARVIKLEQNYRSTQNILDAANTLIANNIDRKPKTLWTEIRQATASFTIWRRMNGTRPAISPKMSSSKTPFTVCLSRYGGALPHQRPVPGH